MSAERLEELLTDPGHADNATTAEAVWRVSFLLAFPGSYVKSWSVREKAQYNSLKKELPDRAALYLLAEVAGRWPDFVQRLAVEAGHRNVGAKPHLGLLLYHRQVAVDMCSEEQDASACAEPGGEPAGKSWETW